MKPARLVLSLGCSAAAFIASGEQLAARAATRPTAVELQPLQGTWAGGMVGDESLQRITITITGNSLHFHRDANFWFETAITVPAGKNPKQLHATIKDCPPSQASSIGKVVGALFKIEDGTLTLATSGEMPERFEDKGLTRYELRKVQPKENGTQPQTK